jgi:hypothetical protein
MTGVVPAPAGRLAADLLLLARIAAAQKLAG